MNLSRTSWTLIHDAAHGDDASRERFASLYGPVISAYLQARWREPSRREWIEDVAQDVFIECFRGGGVLNSVAERRPASFRAYLFGVTQNLASRAERRAKSRREIDIGEPEIESCARSAEIDPRVAFERQWARALITEAIRSMGDGSPEAAADVQLIELRVRDGLPVREIARLRDRPAEQVHRDYARARRRFKRALFELVLAHESGPDVDAASECERLFSILG